MERALRCANKPRAKLEGEKKIRATKCIYLQSLGYTGVSREYVVDILKIYTCPFTISINRSKVVGHKQQSGRALWMKTSYLASGSKSCLYNVVYMYTEGINVLHKGDEKKRKKK